MADNQRDQISSTTEKVVTAGGAVVGAGAGAAVAAAVGTSSVPIITTIASWVGITAVAATPVGWIIGAAALGAAVVGGATYGVTKLVGHNGKIEGKQEADEEARIAEEEQKQLMNDQEILCRKEQFQDLGFRCIEPATMNLLDSTKAEVVAYGYQMHKENDQAKPTNNPAFRIYSVKLDGQEAKLFDENYLSKLFGEAFTKLK